MSFSPAGGANGAPQTQSLNFRGHFEAGKREKKRSKETEVDPQSEI